MISNRDAWKRMAAAVDYYDALGFKYVEVPWMVPTHISDATLPLEKQKFPYLNTVNGFHLIGSGEQGFLLQAATDRLPPGLYQTITPCFRQELTYDALHTDQFFKLELIDILNAAEHNKRSLIMSMVTLAGKFFEQYMPIGLDFINLKDENIDIVDRKNGLEIGSYGYRKYEHKEVRNGRVEWIYGTGLAEPRFSEILRRQK